MAIVTKQISRRMAAKETARRAIAEYLHEIGREELQGALGGLRYDDAAEMVIRKMEQVGETIRTVARATE